MKTHKHVIALIILTTMFQWSCQKETDLTNYQVITLRHHNPGHNNGGGNGGGGDDNGGEESVYGFLYNGPDVFAETTYGTVSDDNNKFTLLDAQYCGSIEFTGMGTLSACFPVVNCTEFLGIKQLNKKKDPSWVRSGFTVRDPITLKNSRLSMWGRIQNMINGEYTVKPVSGQDVEVIFDEWAINSFEDECQQEKITFNSIGLPDQSLTIWLVSEEEIPTICNGVGLNCP